VWKETGKEKSRWTIQDLLTSGREVRWAVLGFIAATDVRRLVPGDEAAESEASEWELRERLEREERRVEERAVGVEDEGEDDFFFCLFITREIIYCPFPVRCPRSGGSLHALTASSYSAGTRLPTSVAARKSSTARLHLPSARRSFTFHRSFHLPVSFFTSAHRIFCCGFHSGHSLRYRHHQHCGVGRFFVQLRYCPVGGGGRWGATTLLAHPGVLGVRGTGLGASPLFFSFLLLLFCYFLGAIYRVV